MRPYLAIDIETTGLDKSRSQILQLAAIWDDGASPVSQLQKFSTIVDNGPLTYGEPYALQLNSGLLKKIANTKERAGILAAPDAAMEFSQFVRRLNKNQRITVAGKNAAGFDVPILFAQGFDTELFSHRVIDPGSMYFSDFGYVPNLGEINERLGRKPVSHDAYDDCLDVIAAIRAKCGVAYE